MLVDCSLFINLGWFAQQYSKGKVDLQTFKSLNFSHVYHLPTFFSTPAGGVLPSKVSIWSLWTWTQVRSGSAFLHVTPIYFVWAWSVCYLYHSCCLIPAVGVISQDHNEVYFCGVCSYFFLSVFFVLLTFYCYLIIWLFQKHWHIDIKNTREWSGVEILIIHIYRSEGECLSFSLFLRSLIICYFMQSAV
jgi:hypothetical protein